MYNPGIAKFLSVDPLSPNYPFFSPYQFAGDSPIEAVDLDGLELLPVENPWSIAQEHGVSLHELAKANRNNFTGDINSPDYFTKGVGKLWNIDEGDVIDIPILTSKKYSVGEVLGDSFDSVWEGESLVIDSEYAQSYSTLNRDKSINTMLFAIAWGLDLVDFGGGPHNAKKSARNPKPRRGGAHGGTGSPHSIDVNNIPPAYLKKKFKGEQLDPNFKPFNLTVKNGTISSPSITPGQRYSYVLTNDGELRVGPLRPGTHYGLAGGANSVRGAGKIEFNANGKITYKDNDSGHYTPGIETSNAAFDALGRAGYLSPNAVNGTIDFGSGSYPNSPNSSGY